jgi:HPt (histidine-containing phosphotransfer) domain-containing protein
MTNLKDTLSNIKKYLADEFAMEEDEVTEMVELFLESVVTSGEKAKNEVANGNATQLANIGHTIKGSAANINALYFSELGLDIETAAKNDDISLCNNIITKLNDSIATVKTEYENQS